MSEYNRDPRTGDIGSAERSQQESGRPPGEHDPTWQNQAQQPSVREEYSSTTERAQDQFGSGSTGGEVRDRAEDMTAEAKDRAEGMTGEVKEQAHGMRSRANEYGHKAKDGLESGKEQLANGMEKAAHRVRERSNESGDFPDKAAGSMEDSARYLHQHSTDQIWDDVEEYIREHPGQAVAGAIVAGFLLGKVVL